MTDDLQRYRDQAARRAAAVIIQSKRARAAKPAETAKAAKAAEPAPIARPVPPTKRKGKPATPQPNLVVLDGGKAKGFKVGDMAVARARARAVKAQPSREAMLQAAKAVFKPYEPPKGIVPEGESARLANDAALPVAGASIMNWAGDLMVQGGYLGGLTFPGYPILAEMAQRTEYRKPAERLATECTRKWIKLTSTAQEDKSERISAIEKRLKELKLRENYEQLIFMDATMGRGHLYLDTGDTDNPNELLQPLGNGRNEASLAKISPEKPLQRLQVVDPTWVYPARYNATNPLKQDWLRPSTWFSMGTEIHTSRLLPFIGREVPDLLKPAFAFGGLSLTQMLQPYVENWTSTREHIARLVANFSKNGVSTDLQQMLAPNPNGSASDGTDLFNRIALYTSLSDNNGMLVLDKNAEEFFQFNTPLGTLDQLQAQSLEQMCLPTSMPVVILLGLTPHGLNASSEGEMRAWEAWAEAYQKHFNGAAGNGDTIQRVIDFVQLSLFGDIDTSISYEWVPLRTLDDKELAEMRKIDAERDKVYVDGAVIDPIEVRQKLAADPNSGYSNINPEDVPEPPEDDHDALGEEDGSDGEAGSDGTGPFANDAGGWREAEHPRDHDGRFASSEGSPTALKWAKEGHQAGLTSTYDPKKHGSPTLYHGVKPEHERKGFLFVTRDPEAAAFHGAVKSFKMKPGASIYADIEQEKKRSGEQTLLKPKASESSGIVHIDDLVGDFARDEASFEESKHPREQDGKFAPKGGGGSGAAAQSSKKKPTQFGGLWKDKGDPKASYEATSKYYLEQPAKSGSHYRNMLAHMIKEAPKHGHEADVSALKDKLSQAYANAAEQLFKRSFVETDAAKAKDLAAAGQKALTKAKEMGWKGGAGPKWSASGSAGTALAGFREETQRALVTEGMKTGTENLSAFDVAANKPISDDIVGIRTKNFVGITAAGAAMLTDPSRKIEVHHNHPSSSSFSSGDLDMAAKSPGMSRLYAHGHDGSTFALEKADKYAAEGLRRARMVLHPLLEKGLQTKDPEIVEIPYRMLTQFESHAALTGLAQAGMVGGYEAYPSKDFGAELGRRKALFERMVEKAKWAAEGVVRR